MPNTNKLDCTITTIEMLRHGECVGGTRYRGKLTDDALTDEGMHRMLGKVETLDWDCIVSSPLKRCAAFARHLSDSCGTPLLFHKDLKEISFGRWDGKLIDDVWNLEQSSVEAWFDDPVNSPPPDGEPADTFAKRVINACESLVAEHVGKKLLFVCHGGVMRVLLGNCLNVNYQSLSNFDVPYGCFSRIQIIDDGEKKYYRLLNHNI